MLAVKYFIIEKSRQGGKDEEKSNCCPENSDL
jgi:hypothetical protein